jgi:hypothetical protein
MLQLLNLQPQRQLCSRLERFYIREKYCLFLKTHHAISCTVNVYNAGVGTHVIVGLAPMYIVICSCYIQCSTHEVYIIS